jgi:hypothetical protein
MPQVPLHSRSVQLEWNDVQMGDRSRQLPFFELLDTGFKCLDAIE